MECKLCGKDVNFLVKGICNDCMREYGAIEEEEEIIDTKYRADYDLFQPSTWIRGLKILSLINFIGNIFISIFIGAKVAEIYDGGYGFISAIAYLMISFMVCAFVMIVANAAQDIAEINYKMKSR